MRLQNPQQLFVHSKPAVVIVVDAVAIDAVTFAATIKCSASQPVRLHVLQ